jgi:hypothetical protein
MDANKYKELSIDKRVEYLNSELKNGNSLSYIFTKILGVSKSQSSIIKKNGYMFIDNEFVKSEEQSECPELRSTELKNTIHIGRPSSSVEKISATLNLNKKSYKVLQVYALLNDTNVSELVNDFMSAFIKEKNLNLDIYKK